MRQYQTKDSGRIKQECIERPIMVLLTLSSFLPRVHNCVCLCIVTNTGDWVEILEVRVIGWVYEEESGDVSAILRVDMSLRFDIESMGRTHLRIYSRRR